MSVTDGAPVAPQGRKRGGTRRIDRASIIDVAKTFDPQNITMQAVADKMGVDRKALNYHVTDREGLLRLVAADVFESSFSQVFASHFSPADADEPDAWKKAVSAWATAVRDGMVAAGVPANYYVINSDNLSVFEPVELVLQQLIAAGFDQTVASRAVIFLTHFAMGVGRDIVMETQLGEHPQSAEVRRMLSGSAEAEKFEALQVLMKADLNALGDMQSQFDFEVDVFVRGMEQQLGT
jgi:TetR/AcrR family transcriptional regulator, tetracycline repressor protein